MLVSLNKLVEVGDLSPEGVAEDQEWVDLAQHLVQEEEWWPDPRLVSPPDLIVDPHEEHAQDKHDFNRHCLQPDLWSYLLREDSSLALAHHLESVVDVIDGQNESGYRW